MIWRFIPVACLLLVLACAPALAADPIPTPFRFQIERSRPTRMDIPLKRGEYVDLQLQYFDYGVPVDLSSASGIYFTLTAGTVTNAYPARIISATNGLVGFLITPTNLWAATSYVWEMPVVGPTSAMIRAYGTLSVSSSIAYQGLTNTPPPMGSADFATLILYNIGLSPWPSYAWVTNYVGAHGGGFVNWTDIQDKPGLVTKSDFDSGIAGLSNYVQSVADYITNNLPAGGGSGGGGTNVIVIQNNSTNIAVAMTVNTNIIVSSTTVTNLYLYETNSSITNVSITNNITGMTEMPATWDADQIGTNALYYRVGGETTARIDSNGLTMLKGSVQLYEEDLNCNVRLYDGSRLAPSLTFLGHTNEWGLFARGYGGHYCGSWSVAGTEVGVMHAGGLSLMSSNFAFYGSCVGDISQCTGYPEPLFEQWKTNVAFSFLNLNNLTIAPGGISILDSVNTPRILLTNGTITVRDAGGINRATLDTALTVKDSLGRTVAVHDRGLTTYEAVSGLPYLQIGTPSFGYDTIYCSWNQNPVYKLNPAYGFQLWDPFQGPYRGNFSYNLFMMQDGSSNLLCKIDASTPNTPLVTRGIQLTNLASSITCSLTSTTNGALVMNGKTILATNYPSFNLTNVFGGVTSVLWFANGIVTNKTP